MTRQIAADFFEDTLQALPYRAHTVLTDNWVQFAKKAGTEAYERLIFDVVCYRHGIENHLAKKEPERFHNDPNHYFTGPNT
ncbi:hypothetical protein DFO67_11061 [Modicisalibacter xianhensis]|uniref:Uncharacterized protein n=1 Tax=Modicisalibacter xianhensis TaxID=442341 RepID=A0A4R8FWC0_9GAMM|nr:hypothetical protein [Halomonas xianhensis]TDX28361.1 hypothetical protein DFO67_11061 [Halomonas xianhensis]